MKRNSEYAMSENQRKVSNLPLAEVVYSKLRTEIINNKLLPGEQILEKVLVERFGCSRTPIREACVRLEKEGLIEIKPRHGIKVKPISVVDMSDIYDVLNALETEAARKLASLKLTEEQLKPLIESTNAMQKALEDDCLEEWAESDERFHIALVELTGNQRLIDAVFQLWGQAHRVRYATLNLRDKPFKSTQDHMELVEAIRSGDVEGAARLHREHRINGKKTLLSILEKYRFKSM